MVIRWGRGCSIVDSDRAELVPRTSAKSSLENVELEQTAGSQTSGVKMSLDAEVEWEECISDKNQSATR